MKVFFLPETGLEIGYGHIMRLTSIFDSLKKKFECEFLIQNLDESLKIQFTKQNIPFYHLKNQFDTIEITDFTKPGDIIFCDGYHFDTQFQNELIKKKIILIYIDDLYIKKSPANAIINHSPSASTEKYSAYAKSKLFLGLKYSMIRKSFRKAVKNREINFKQLNCLVAFGGSDPLCLTSKTILALHKIKAIKNIFVIEGNSFATNQKEQLHKFAENKKIKLYKNLSALQIKNLMAKSHFGILPSSVTLFEALATKLPVISGYFIENQIETNKGFSQLGLIHNIGDFNTISVANFEKEIKNFILPDNLKVLSKNLESRINLNQPNAFHEIIKSLTVTK